MAIQVRSVDKGRLYYYVDQPPSVYVSSRAVLLCKQQLGWSVGWSFARSRWCFWLYATAVAISCFPVRTFLHWMSLGSGVWEIRNYEVLCVLHIKYNLSRHRHVSVCDACRRRCLFKPLRHAALDSITTGHLYVDPTIYLQTVPHIYSSFSTNTISPPFCVRHIARAPNA